MWWRNLELTTSRAYFAELLGDAVTQAKFAAHEYNEEVIPQVASEYEQAIRDPSTYALDLAHQLAFRHGLGNSLFASPHTAVDFSSATAFAKSALSSSNFAVLSTGVDSGLLNSLVADFFVTPSAAALSSPASAYFGGELRVPSVGHGSSLDHFLLAFKGASTSTAADLTVLRYLLGGESAVKWSAGLSPLSKLASGQASAHAFNLTYSDAGLFGVYISAPTSAVGGLAVKVVNELKNVAKGASAEAVAGAIAKAKFAAAAAVESRVGRLELVGAQVRDLVVANEIWKLTGDLDRSPTLDRPCRSRRSLRRLKRLPLTRLARCVRILLVALDP